MPQPAHAHVSSAYAPIGDTVTLHLVATGLLDLLEATRGGAAVGLPYPAPLQQGLNRLTLSCMYRGVPAPAGVPDLLAWCGQPLGTWPVHLEEGVAGPGDTLLDGPIPTRLCLELVVDSRDVEAEVWERHLLLDVLDTCRVAGDQAGYVAFRRTLIERPVLTALEIQQRLAEPALGLLVEQLRSAYRAAPAECFLLADLSPDPREGPARPAGRICHTCHWCGGLLVRLRGGDLRCGEDACHSVHPPRRGRQLSERDGVYVLRRELQTFIAAPGRAELRLAATLGGLGLTVELWPAIDAYDLRIVFPSGRVWAVDVKDQASPVLLARRLARRIPPEPAWERGFYVFPKERARRSDYLRAFRGQARVLGGTPPIAALMEPEFVALVRRTLASERTAQTHA